MLNFAQNNKISDFDYKTKDITHKDKDKNDIPVTLEYLSAQSRQSVLSRMIANTKTLSTLKAKGKQRPGALKFKSEVNVVDFKQLGTSHKIINRNKIKLAGIPKHLRVNGLSQFIDKDDVDITTARLVKVGSDYYVQFCVFEPRREKGFYEYDEVIGVDFGCETALTLSNGDKITAVIEESGRLRRLQRKLARQEKCSSNYWRTRDLIKREYARISNRKDDKANKIVHELLKYKTVVMQDEQLAGWQKNRHGKAVQHGVLGRVKSRLMMRDNVVVLGRFMPTSKLCTECGCYHDELPLSTRVFECDCGVNQDRDVHAACNMVWFYRHNLGTDRADIKRAELEPLVRTIIRSGQVPTTKHEAASL